MGLVFRSGKVVNLEGDERLDDREKRRLRRRSTGNAIHEPDSSFGSREKSKECKAEPVEMLDDDYHRYLSDYRNIQCGVDDVVDGDVIDRSVRDEDMDPQYKMFLENLREYGNSYVLQVVQDDGRVKEIRYHQENGAPDEVDLDTMNYMGKMKKKTESANRETVEIVEEAPKRRGSVKKRNVKLEAVEPVSDGAHVHPSKRPRSEVSNTPESIGSQLKQKTGRSYRMVIEKRHSDSCPQKENGIEKTGLRSNVKVTNKYNLRGRTNSGPNKISGSRYLHFQQGGCNNEAGSDSDATDETYREFLSGAKKDGKGLVFISKTCGTLRYNEESSSDSDVAVLERDSHEGFYTPATKGVASFQSTESHSQFRQGILQELKRPYTAEEYLTVLENWSRQRPSTGHDKNLRHGVTKSYALEGEFGKSYQEMYKDLARKLEAVTGGDRPRKLNLLRGFFYWLRNITQQGSFIPWNDKACLKVLPRKH